MFKKINEIIDANMDTVTNNSFLFIIKANKCIQEALFLNMESVSGDLTLQTMYKYIDQNRFSQNLFYFIFWLDYIRRVDNDIDWKY